jgi:putative transcriptional regulator
MAHGRLLHVAYTVREDRFRLISARVLSHEKDGAIMKARAKKKTRIDWSALDAMTDTQRHAAAMADPDARPMTDEEWAAAPRVPRVSIIRRAFRLSQQEFAEQYCIPIGTLRDWEQGRKEPDAAAKAYLHVIASEPEMVHKALSRGPRAPRSPNIAARSRRRSLTREALGLEEEAAPRLAKPRKKRSR